MAYQIVQDKGTLDNSPRNSHSLDGTLARRPENGLSRTQSQRPAYSSSHREGSVPRNTQYDHTNIPLSPNMEAKVWNMPGLIYAIRRLLNYNVDPIVSPPCRTPAASGAARTVNPHPSSTLSPDTHNVPDLSSLVSDIGSGSACMRKFPLCAPEPLLPLVGKSNHPRRPTPNKPQPLCAISPPSSTSPVTEGRCPQGGEAKRAGGGKVGGA